MKEGTETLYVQATCQPMVDAIPRNNCLEIKNVWE
jgi:hypothetical protein